MMLCSQLKSFSAVVDCDIFHMRTGKPTLVAGRAQLSIRTFNSFLEYQILNLKPKR